MQWYILNLIDLKKDLLMIHRNCCSIKELTLVSATVAEIVSECHSISLTIVLRQGSSPALYVIFKVIQFSYVEFGMERRLVLAV